MIRVFIYLVSYGSLDGGMRGKSSSCEGIYKLIRSHGCRG